jgi:hypothetical protein
LLQLFWRWNHELFAQAGLTLFFLISASQVARDTGMSH